MQANVPRQTRAASTREVPFTDRVVRPAAGFIVRIPPLRRISTCAAPANAGRRVPTIMTTRSSPAGALRVIRCFVGGSLELSLETRPGLRLAQRHEVLRAFRREGHDEEGRVLSAQGACLNKCRHDLVGGRVVCPVRVEARTRGSCVVRHGLIVIVDRERCCGLERKCRGRRGRIVIATTGGKKDRQQKRERQPPAGQR